MSGARFKTAVPIIKRDFDTPSNFLLSLSHSIKSNYINQNSLIFQNKPNPSHRRWNSFEPAATSKQNLTVKSDVGRWFRVTKFSIKSASAVGQVYISVLHVRYEY